jgi:hypothetical protein
MDDMEEMQEPRSSTKRPFAGEPEAGDIQECASLVQMEDMVGIGATPSSKDEDTSGSEGK